jgi:hypothetical protein
MTFPMSSFLSEFNHGQYRMIIDFYIKENGPSAGNCSITGTFKGPMKESFG